ncbi:hypothetical protein PBI_MARTIN_58 [Microbacterium phage Martin]|uniref:Uncharacterized protein n=46 Tax=Ilzatvirus TaxID=2560150 RepID=A0A5J6TGS0_9CAUD|nr:hypothetical protein FDJ36_gp56 [Microbacterium phage Ilzat]AUX82643.1 hypothetical protein PBI_AUBERGINE_56 [Microbacterium phage Aubergine]AUX82706.1 hypothetical protein PBI_AXIPUP_57 [Microbacterium phage AxiPup]AUX82830.1 hypothetical protein PBI_ESPINOSA_56 [Microbacterium phage Espinosa]AUX82955.1 hypothetical protein PBI_KALE_56 [Microbacterium phage Kale]AUX83081.1 hypothetical protein PBI_LUDGATE_57 [Microbacterium phage Ludgate]AUX83458.1 hypothetical protein PBI_TENDA_56 [Micro
MNEVWRELTAAQASSLWTFGRATPMDGDRLAWYRYWDRHVAKYFRAQLAEIERISNNLGMEKDTFENLLNRMAALDSIPLEARELFDAMLRENFVGMINDD